MNNIIGLGDSELLCEKIKEESVDLIFTSPPYFNVKPEYSEYPNYNDYLIKMENIIIKASKVLKNGRFFILNSSHVIVPRKKRSEESVRLPVPFDLHNIMMRNGFDFIDDIHWVKPSGAGWASGRGRRFSKDRSPLQYKTVPVTEYVMVYRKKSNKLIDCILREVPVDVLVKSKINGDYNSTNLWKLNPCRNKNHPAVFPVSLSNNIVKYYSFVGDTVMDMFAGSGTVGDSCISNNRNFVLFDHKKDYVDLMIDKFKNINFDFVEL